MGQSPILRTIDEIRENDNKTNSGFSNTQYLCLEMPADCCSKSLDCSLYLLQCGHVYHSNCLKLEITKQFAIPYNYQLFCHCKNKIKLAFLRSQAFKDERALITQVYRNQFSILIDHLDGKVIDKKYIKEQHDKNTVAMDYNL